MDEFADTMYSAGAVAMVSWVSGSGRVHTARERDCGPRPLCLPELLPADPLHRLPRLLHPATQCE